MARGRWAVLGAAVLWSLGGVIVRGFRLDPVSIAVFRSLFAGLVLIPVVPARSRRLRVGMIPVAMIFGAMVGLYLSAIESTNPTSAILLQSTATFWTVPATLFLLRERPDRRSMLGIGLVTLGAAVIVALGRSGKPGEEWGVLYGLLSGVGYAAVMVSLRAFREEDSAWLSAVNNLGGAVALGGFAWIVWGRIPLPSGWQWPALVAFGTVQMAIPYTLFARGLRTIPAPEAGLIALLEPTLTPIWVFLAFGEKPTGFTLLGGLILLGGVAVRYLPAKPRRGAREGAA